MVVQAVSENETEIPYIEIPENVPSTVIENDTLLALEASINKIEDKVVLTARSLLGISSEMKAQLFEIERLERTIVSMHDYMVDQYDRISVLEDKFGSLQNDELDQMEPKQGFWAKLFSK